MTHYFEMAAASNFSFLCGASHPQELVARAHELGLSGIGIADRNTLAGVVRAHAAWKDFRDKSDFRLFIGCRLSFIDGTPDMVVYPRDRAAYGQLCRLLTEGKVRAAIKGECHLEWSDLLFRARQFQIAVFPPEDDRPDFAARLTEIAQAAPDSVWLALAMPHQGHDGRRAERIARFAAEANVPLLATNDVLYHHPDRRALQDVLTATRHHTTVFAAGRLLEKNAERHLKPPKEMLRLFRDYTEAVEATADFVAPITFQLDELKYDYPDEPVPPGKTPQQHLHDLTWAGAARHYGADSIPPKVQALIHKELALIEKLQYAAYFLTVYDIVSYARSKGILCQGRGSAANSVVCFCLGVTGVDPTQVDLLFERFLSVERKEPPDIDVDFEHERREEVMQYVYDRYTRDRAAIVATVISYRSRSAIRDVGKALGLTEDVTAALANTVWGISGGGIDKQHIRQAGLDPDNPIIRRAVELAITLIGFPRHLSQHVGGFVLTRDRLDETVPIGPAVMDKRSFIEWDKDDIDEVGLMKVDVLSLGMLTCIRKAFDLIHQHKPEKYDGKKLTLANLPREDEAVYDMLCKGDSLGVFQVESRAQMNMLPRLRPKTFYDLVIQVAIVRPGPIQGDMVHPYLRRRNKEEEVDYPSEELKPVFERTLGVPLFQEQVMELAIVAAEYTPDEADKLRRAMAAWKRHGSLEPHRVRLTERMLAKGYQPDFIARIFEQIKGFGSYGFPESHAASFALLTYASCWLKRHEPAAFACALINSWPMGFYNPDQILQDARRHRLEIRPVDVRHSGWDCSLEPSRQAQPAIRLGLRMVRGFRETDAQRIEAARQRQPFTDIHDLCLRAELEPRAREQLADAGALRGLAGHRHRARWAVAGIEPQLPLFASLPAPEETSINLPLPSVGEDLFNDYATLGTTLGPHPLLLLRDELKARRCRSSRELGTIEHGRPVSVAGLVIGRQRPQTASGVIFVTLEDEFGMVNVVVWRDLAERQRRPLLQSQLLRVDGHLESASGVRHLIAGRLSDLTPLLTGLDVRSRDFQ